MITQYLNEKRNITKRTYIIICYKINDPTDLSNRILHKINSRKKIFQRPIWIVYKNVGNVSIDWIANVDIFVFDAEAMVDRCFL